MTNTLNFKLICHPSQAMLHLKLDETLTSWGKKKSQTRSIEKFAQGGGANLFGDSPIAVLEIDDPKTQIKEIVAYLEKTDESIIKSKISSGLIILTTAAANQTKKIISLVKKAGGIVDATAKSNAVTNDLQIIRDLGLSKNVENFLIDWAGQETANLVSIVRSLESLSPTNRKKVTIDDVIMRLPLPPGSVPPWDIEKPLMAKDLTSAVELYRRIAGRTGPLLALWTLNNKFQNLYKVAYITKYEPRIDNAELMSILNNVRSPKQLSFFKTQAKKIGTVKLEKIVEILSKLDSEFKSGVSQPDARFEIALAEIIRIL